MTTMSSTGSGESPARSGRTDKVETPAEPPQHGGGGARSRGSSRSDRCEAFNASVCARSLRFASQPPHSFADCHGSTGFSRRSYWWRWSSVWSSVSGSGWRLECFTSRLHFCIPLDGEGDVAATDHVLVQESSLPTSRPFSRGRNYAGCPYVSRFELIRRL
jgi:hypothetical protein